MKLFKVSIYYCRDDGFFQSSPDVIDAVHGVQFQPGTGALLISRGPGETTFVAGHAYYRVDADEYEVSDPDPDAVVMPEAAA